MDVFRLLELLKKIVEFNHGVLAIVGMARPCCPGSRLTEFGLFLNFRVGDHVDPIAADELAFDRDCLAGLLGQRLVGRYVVADQQICRNLDRV
jgi:hypothetical protein